MSSTTIIDAHQPGELGGTGRATLVRGGLGAGATLLLAGAVAALWLAREPAVAAPRLELPTAMRAQIEAMSTGSHQALVVSGKTAEARNAAIPLTTAPLDKIAGFAVIGRDLPQYAEALTCLTQAVYYEAANEPGLGKRAVAQVVLNRLRHPAYPNSVCGVVYEGANAPVCQFSFTCDGSLLRAPMPRQWAQSRAVAAAALAGDTAPEVGSATHYHANYVLPRWAFTLGKLRQIGVHIFYRFPGRIGSGTAFTDSWDGTERIPALNMQRLRLALEADAPEAALTVKEIELVPNLTVTPDVKDRHAAADVGGRLDVTTGWRLSIPDPVELSASYRSAVDVQADAASAAELEAQREVGDAAEPAL